MKRKCYSKQTVNRNNGKSLRTEYHFKLKYPVIHLPQLWRCIETTRPGPPPDISKLSQTQTASSLSLSAGSHKKFVSDDVFCGRLLVAVCRSLVSDGFCKSSLSFSGLARPSLIAFNLVCKVWSFICIKNWRLINYNRKSQR